MLHVLRYLRNNSIIGIKFYSNAMDAPITRMLIDEKIQNTSRSYFLHLFRTLHRTMMLIVEEVQDVFLWCTWED
jgi:hypothetical protein